MARDDTSKELGTSSGLLPTLRVAKDGHPGVWAYSMGLFCGFEAVFGEVLLDGRGAQPVEKGVGVGAVRGVAHDDGALTDLRIGGAGDADERAELLEVVG